MRIPLRSLPIRAGYPSIYENGAPAGGVSPRRALSFPYRCFLSENAAAIESRACRVLSSSSGRAPRDENRLSYIEEAHSRDQHCPANYYTLINRTRVACDSISPLSPAISHSPCSISLFRAFPHSRSSSAALITALLSSYPSPSFFSPLHAQYAPRAYGLTVRECHGPDHFSRPRTVDAASGERRTGVVR